MQQQWWPYYARRRKYADLDSRYLFEPITFETLGVLNSSANSLLKEIDKKISLNTGKSREVSFLHQRISVLVQRFNAILLYDSLPTIDCADRISYPQLFSYSYFLNPHSETPTDGFKSLK